MNQFLKSKLIVKNPLVDNSGVWSPPPTGWVKYNVDGDVQHSDLSGWVW